MAHARNIKFANPEPPSFLKKLRADHGMQATSAEDHQVALAMKKRQMLEGDDDDLGGARNEEEQPQVVVLRKGHLSLEQARAAAAGGAVDKDGVLAPEDGAKEEAAKEGKDEAAGTTDAVSDAKQSKPDKPAKKGAKKIDGVASKKTKRRRIEGKQSAALKKKNTSLLSFGDDEDED
eukprot:m.256161 g.256161  ORF g.256161 m.256161 type:complete len:177 (-) comp19169_c0_seq6:307-837(-)